jgi:hypothetical protein
VYGIDEGVRLRGVREGAPVAGGVDPQPSLLHPEGERAPNEAPARIESAFVHARARVGAHGRIDAVYERDVVARA